MTSWTGGRKRTKPLTPSIKKTLIVQNVCLFAKRDRQGKISTKTHLELSELMLLQASERWEEILILIAPTSIIGNYFVEKDFVAFVEELGIKNIQLITFPIDSTEEKTNFLKKQLIQRGAKIKPAKNPREVTYLNLEKYIEAPHMTWVGLNDHTKARIDLDKPKSFKELQEERKLRSTW